MNLDSVFKEELAKSLDSFGLPYKGEQIDQFAQFYHMLIDKNKVMNLTAISEPKEVAIKHIVDSLSVYSEKYFAGDKSIIDIGTGAGFPGIPLAIYDENLQITLFDSLKKRLNFLEEVIENLGLNKGSKGKKEYRRIVTLHGRAEEMAHNPAYAHQFDLGMSRAVARLPILLEWALPFIKKNGMFIAMKGAAYEEEIGESKNALSLLGGSISDIKPVKLPEINDKRALIYVAKDGITPKKYPRKPKEIREHPL